MSRIRKAVIPAAGIGMNFLPATKAQPKELIPIVDKPVIQFIVEEAFESGIEEILIITGKHKRSIEDHFDSNIELEENLRAKGKVRLLEIAQSTTKENLFFVRQPYPKGLGDAIYHAKAFVNNEPFVVLLGDNITVSDVPVTKQLMDLYEGNHAPNLAVVEVPKMDTHKYGFIELESHQDESMSDVYAVRNFIEKPGPESAPSSLAIAGRYVLTPEIFPILEEIDTGIDDELQLTDAIDQLNRTHRVFAKKIEGHRYDVGDKIGYMKMSIDYGLIHEETQEAFREYILDLGAQLEEARNHEE